MSSMYGVIDRLAAAGAVSGWRVDALLVGGCLWALAATVSHLRLALH